MVQLILTFLYVLGTKLLFCFYVLSSWRQLFLISLHKCMRSAIHCPTRWGNVLSCPFLWQVWRSDENHEHREAPQDHPHHPESDGRVARLQRECFSARRAGWPLDGPGCRSWRWLFLCTRSTPMNWPTAWSTQPSCSSSKTQSDSSRRTTRASSTSWVTTDWLAGVGKLFDGWSHNWFWDLTELPEQEQVDEAFWWPTS